MVLLILRKIKKIFATFTETYYEDNYECEKVYFDELVFFCNTYIN